MTFKAAAKIPLIFDTHIDIPWEERDLSGLPVWSETDQASAWAEIGQEEGERRFTFPKARKGGMNAACLAAYIPQSALTPEGHDAAWRRTMAMLEHIKAYGRHKTGQVAHCSTAEEIRHAVESGQCAVVAVVENAYGLADNLDRIAHLARDYGIRYITLTHNGHNLLADSAMIRAGYDEPQERHGGLSALGREAIGVMNRAGVLVDVSHASRRTMLQAVEISHVPVLASHSCVRALCDHPRNLDDQQLDALKESGGLVQITAMAPFLRKGGGGTLDDLITHITYVARRIGVEHVGFSSDFDGGGHIEGWQDASQTGRIPQALLKAGFDISELHAVLGGNMMRLLQEAEHFAS